MWIAIIWQRIRKPIPRENVKKANALAEMIKGVIGAKRAESKYAKVKYAVIIGSDAVIPFYRTKESLPHHEQ